MSTARGRRICRARSPVMWRSAANTTDGERAHMTTPFDINNWFWFVGGDETRAYSSKRNIYVDPASDADYLAWKLATNMNAVPIPNETELWYYMSRVLPPWIYAGGRNTFVQPAEGAYTKMQLKGYAHKVQDDTSGAGITAEGVPLATDFANRQRIDTGRTAAEVDNQYATTVLGTDGKLYPVDSGQIIAISDATLAFVTDINDTYALVHADIDAGAITSLEQIDSAFETGVRRTIKNGRSNHYRRKRR